MRRSAPSQPKGNRKQSHSGKVKTCPACKEPETTFVTQTIGKNEVEICISCDARLKARVDVIRARERERQAEARDIAEVRKNQKGDRRRGSEEVWMGGEIDSFLSEEEM
jgi:hypothetical protein